MSLDQSSALMRTLTRLQIPKTLSKFSQHPRKFPPKNAHLTALNSISFMEYMLAVHNVLHSKINLSK